MGVTEFIATSAASSINSGVIACSLSSAMSGMNGVGATEASATKNR